MELIKAYLKRGEDNGKETVGKFSFGDFNCDTLERPYLDNQHGISSIPASQYLCKKIPATAKIPYEHISITDVPNRSGICIHTANLVTQLEGCVAVGSGYGDINSDGLKDVLNSKLTFEKLMAAVPDEFILVVS